MPKIILLGAAIIGLLAGCTIATKTVPTNQGVPFETLAHGIYSFEKSPQAYVITDQANFTEVWKKIFSVYYPEKKIPAIDFSQSVVVAAFLGEKSSGGYTITITHIETDNESIKIFTHKTVPPAGSATVAVMTQPYHLVKIARSSKPIIFIPE